MFLSFSNPRFDLDFKFNNLNWHVLLPADKKAEGRSRVDRDADNLQLQQLEEKDVVSSVANVLSDLCGPGEWMPMEKLHAVVSSSDHYLFYVTSCNS
jgi:hypothetical protein